MWHVRAENIAQTAPAGGGEMNRARPALTGNPAAFEATATDLRADMPGNVESALAPVEARAAEDPAAAGR